jgi:2-polyprenyl-3-methyl-5-hydroxy-6-metoxy-1,4-benzoquinol methylase
MTYNIGKLIHSTQACKICHGHELSVVATKGRHFQELTTTICTGCGLVHSYPIPTEDELNAYYRKQYRSDYKMAYTPQRKHIIRYARNAMSRIERLKQFTNTNVSLLDIGSGSGEFVYAAQLAGFDVRGIEPHEGYSNYTRKTFDVPVITSTFQDADIADESFDVITLHHVLEHLQYPLTALTHVSKWLKYGGIIMIDVPDIEHTLHSPMNRFHYAHIYNFNHETLKAFLTKAGFEIIKHPNNSSGTILCAKKVQKADYDMKISLKENFEKIFSLLMQGGKAEHYKKKKPLKRFLKKCYIYPKEFIQGCYLWCPKQIVKREFKRSQNK